MDWEDLRHFAAFAASGSLSAAARRLGVEHATVARRIAALEMRLDLKLIDRRGRRLALTADGRRIAAITDRMETDINAIDRIASGARSDLSGEVTISAPSAYAAAILATPLVRLRKRHPDLRVRLLGEARFVSLDRREADIAIRLTRPETGDLTAMKIGEMPFRLYANPDWLAQTPESAWGFIGSTGAMATSSQQAALITIAGSRVFGFHSDQVEIQLALACAGGGVALLPDFMAKGRTDLVALTDTMQLTREIWLVVHSDMAASAPVRAVIDCLRGRWE